MKKEDIFLPETHCLIRKIEKKVDEWTASISKSFESFNDIDFSIATDLFHFVKENILNLLPQLFKGLWC